MQCDIRAGNWLIGENWICEPCFVSGRGSQPSAMGLPQSQLTGCCLWSFLGCKHDCFQKKKTYNVAIQRILSCRVMLGLWFCGCPWLNLYWMNHNAVFPTEAESRYWRPSSLKRRSMLKYFYSCEWFWKVFSVKFQHFGKRIGSKRGSRPLNHCQRVTSVSAGWSNNHKNTLLRWWRVLIVNVKWPRQEWYVTTECSGQNKTKYPLWRGKWITCTQCQTEWIQLSLTVELRKSLMRVEKCRPGNSTLCEHHRVRRSDREGWTERLLGLPGVRTIQEQ